MLQSFSVRDLQTTAAILSAAAAAGIETLPSLAAALDAALAEQVEPVMAIVPEKKYPVCPSPGCSGVLVAWPQASALVGAPVIGCLKCRYSRIEAS